MPKRKDCSKSEFTETEKEIIKIIHRDYECDGVRELCVYKFVCQAEKRISNHLLLYSLCNIIKKLTQ
jgi:hypothetical protein